MFCGFSSQLYPSMLSITEWVLSTKHKMCNKNNIRFELLGLTPVRDDPQAEIGSHKLSISQLQLAVAGTQSPQTPPPKFASQFRKIGPDPETEE